MSLIYELDLMTLVVLMMYQYLHIKNELSESRLLKVEALQTPRSDRGPCQATFVYGKNEACLWADFSTSCEY